MFRRRSPVRGPGLASTVARTAVIAGTATATANAVNSRQAQRHAAAAQQAQKQQTITELQQQVNQLQEQQVQGQLAAGGAVPADDLASQLERLASLHQSGILTEEEFNSAKARLLSA